MLSTMPTVQAVIELRTFLLGCFIEVPGLLLSTIQTGTDRQQLSTATAVAE
jgi:hypothetical protein